jgi:hypothetical protein
MMGGSEITHMSFFHWSDGISGVLDLVEASRASRQCPSDGQYYVHHIYGAVMALSRLLGNPRA